jgi:hypothetical protein
MKPTNNRKRNVMNVVCERCDVSVDTQTEADWEYVYRFTSDAENSHDVVCSRCLSADEATLIGFLVESGYDSLAEWGRDSDYAFYADGCWRDEHGRVVVLVDQLWGAMEAVLS